MPYSNARQSNPTGAAVPGKAAGMAVPRRGRGVLGKLFTRVFWLLGGLAALALGGGAATGYMFFTYGRDLPDHSQLATYEPAVARC